MQRLCLKDDIEAPDVPGTDDKLPDAGMLVHAEYTMHGHFRYLRNLFGRVEKLRVLPRPGLRHAGRVPVGLRRPGG